MAGRRFRNYSGIGGQAVLEGVMMKNKEKYAVAVRRPDGGIEVEVEHYQGVLHGNVLTKIPFVRGIFNFIDSLVLGMKALNYSASFYDEETDGTEPVKKSHAEEKILSTLVTLVSIVLAVGLFILLPFYISSWFEKVLENDSLIAVIEGGVRILIFLLYVWGISFMKDIKRLYKYHGAEHRCINCIERGRPLTVRNVMHCSNLHKRCGTSFIFFVLIVSIILFFFIRVDSVLERVALRILLMPVVAGISYELIWLAGRSDNIIVRILSLPGMLIQRLTTSDPDESMVEVAIASVEAVFDWKEFLMDNFGYDVDGEYVREAPTDKKVFEEIIIEDLAPEGDEDAPMDEDVPASEDFWEEDGTVPMDEGGDEDI